ncbi:MAG: hypothetical protein HY713_13525 [candidate division NC10 bacterium]|nr:hypothetical protein [candidate division NC10 bacterium]
MTSVHGGHATAESPATPESVAVPMAGSPGSDSHGTPRPVPRRRRRGQERPNPWRAYALAWLEKPGCFLCREAAADLTRYYFWFLAEQYANVPTMDRLQRAHGFCLRHTRHLLEHGAPDRTSFVAGYVLRSCADWLRSVQADVTSEGRRARQDGRPSPGRLRPWADCPACESEREERDRYGWVIVECLKEADIRESFCASHGLCIPHFLTAAPLAGWDILQCLAEEQIRHLEEARATLSVSQATGSDGRMADALRKILGRLHGADQDKRIRPLLAAGPSSRETLTAAIGDHVTVRAGTSESWSPAFEETCRLLRQPGCSLCRVAAEGREEYLAWLEEEIRSNVEIRYRWSQAQYLCTEHAWLFADRAAPDVLATVCSQLLDGCVAALRRFLWEIREPIPDRLLGRVRVLPARWRESGRPQDGKGGRPSLSQRVRRTVKTLWLTPQSFLEGVRGRMLRRDACPLCCHLETIETRAADRLLAVLTDAEGRRAFERSYALCLRHAPLLLERASDPGLRRDIAAILLARVEVDRWEAEEYLRKQSWSVRHEPEGDEEAAWLRASARIAGVAMEQHNGF